MYMNNGKENNALDKLVANVLKTRFENFDRQTLEHAKDRIIDTVGCLVGGAKAPGNMELINLARNWGGTGEATLFVHGGKVPAQNAAMINSIMARSFDFEPVGPTVEGVNMPGHVSGTTVMTALAMGEFKRINGKELLCALLAGEDITSRILAGSGFDFTQKWDNIGTVNAFGATAIAGRILGLNDNQMRNAFGIVLNQLGSTFQHIQDRALAFKLPQGLAAKGGIFSAELAQAGWTGPRDILFGKYGYYSVYTGGCTNPDVLIRDLGSQYYSDGIIKPYPCCRVTHAAIDCALAIGHKHTYEPQDIQEINLYVSPDGLDHFCAQPFEPEIGEFPQVKAIWSYKYTVANALLKKSVRPEHFLEQAIKDPQISSIISKVRLLELPGADLHTAKIKVIMKGGKEAVESINCAKGDYLRNPISRADIKAKFWVNIEFAQSVNKRNAERLLNLLENLENLESVNELVELLAVK
jgi:2-methylcitrate dehydratase PrpD